MNTATLAGFILFASVAAFTPGPNNVMLTASGANFGLKRSVPHILGVTIGFCVLVMAGGFGLAALLSAMPQIHTALKLAGISFLLYLAWKIGTSGRTGDKTVGTPITFWQAAMFQVVNPKGVTVLASSVAAYTTDPNNVLHDLLVMVTVFFTVTLAATITWCAFGTMLGRMISSDKALRRFNVGMACLLVLGLLPVLSM